MIWGFWWWEMGKVEFFWVGKVVLLVVIYFIWEYRWVGVGRIWLWICVGIFNITSYLSSQILLLVDLGRTLLIHSTSSWFLILQVSSRCRLASFRSHLRLCRPRDCRGGSRLGDLHGRNHNSSRTSNCRLYTDT